ncbi:hypothetical protein I6F16_36805, partial [Bradyrhizobium sp. IC4060]|nr:hypothetical protein [Bradyrhizobium sp. IC4060]MCA1489167.1 hypothetical protein [Bradyrhizobium sp. IC4061]
AQKQNPKTQENEVQHPTFLQNRILHQDQFCLLLRPTRILHGRRNIAGIVQVQRFDREMTILGLDSAASIVRCSLISRASEAQIALRLDQFAQFQAARLIKMRTLIDNFDIVEQTLGRSIHLPNMSSCVVRTR